MENGQGSHERAQVEGKPGVLGYRDAHAKLGNFQHGLQQLQNGEGQQLLGLSVSLLNLGQ